MHPAAPQDAPADHGVGAAELLPVHESISEAVLPQWWLTNYWVQHDRALAPDQVYSVVVRCGKPGGQQRDREFT